MLRKAGRLDWDPVLDLTRDLDEWQTYRSPREAPAALRRRYQEDRWLGQPYSDFNCREGHAGASLPADGAAVTDAVRLSRGYGSLKLQHDVAEMLRHRFAKTKQLAVIYLSPISTQAGLICSAPGRRRWVTSACVSPTSSASG